MTFRPFRLQPPMTVLGVWSASSPRLTACPGRAWPRTPPFQWDGSSLGLRHYLAGSPRSQAESSSSESYGPAVRLRLLPPPPHGDAVTFSYNVQTEHWQELSSCRSHALTGALGRIFNPSALAGRIENPSDG